MNVAILQTARGGSKSVPNKNTLVFNGKPMFLHNILHAHKSKYDLPVYLSTDIPNLDSLSRKHNFTLIQRPYNLTGSDASHHEVIIHGLKQIEKIQGYKLDILVVVLGNTVSAWSEDIDSAIETLQSRSDIDSVISVGKYSMFNPVRSLSIDTDGSLDVLVDKGALNTTIVNKNINDKEVVGDVYYLNGSLMVMRRSSILSNSSKLPFPWLGNKTLPIVQKSVCMEIDAEWQINIIEKLALDYSIGRK